MKNFILLKRTFTVSKFDRPCDGYYYIIDNSTKEERLSWEINDSNLQMIIKEGEKYIYEVGKENGIFKTMSIIKYHKNNEIMRINYDNFYIICFFKL